MRFPDSAYKTAQAIKDFNREQLPLMIFANCRGFSGGMKGRSLHKLQLLNKSYTLSKHCFIQQNILCFGKTFLISSLLFLQICLTKSSSLVPTSLMALESTSNQSLCICHQMENNEEVLGLLWTLQSMNNTWRCMLMKKAGIHCSGQAKLFI